MSRLVDAWQGALAAEQQAAFGYTILGPRLPASQQKRAHELQSTHESIRDSTAEAIAAHGATPQAPDGDYPDLYPLAKTPTRLAAKLEDDCAAAWRYLFVAAAGSHGAGALLRLAQARLTSSALRALDWRRHLGPHRALDAFPGL